MEKKDTHNIPDNFDKTVNKANKQNEQRKASQVVSGQVVGGGIFFNKKATIIIVLCLILVVASGLTAFLLIKRSHDTQIVTIPDNTNIATLSQEQLKKLANEKISAKTNVDAARKKAEALSQLDDQKSAIVVYQQIEAAGTGNYTDTYNYALAVAATGDYQKSITLLNQALEELKKSNLSDIVKQTETDRITSRITAIQLDGETK